MPTPKLQTSRALEVIPSDTVPIPNPFPMVSGTATDTQSNSLEDTTKDFLALGVRIGDVVYNTSNGTSAVVIADPSLSGSDILSLSTMSVTSGDTYVIYQNSPLSGEPNAGCVLYVGMGGTMTVVTSGGDTVAFADVPTGTFVPVNVVQVLSNGTDAGKIVALW
jgi:hypothetical protein